MRISDWSSDVCSSDLLRLLADSKRRLITTDELRRGIEELGPGVYDEMSYYERWIASITNNLLEKGVISVAELGRRMEIGRASCRERVCQYVSITVVAVSLKKKTNTKKVHTNNI